ncbi:uncharacterized protein LOC108027551 [Drosophila biarmipes]|uniref:uncharacterized protein LOC108027551 n=1 Tax=Drosophila biarmipes TaxID=125945 RepID=UPI0007E785E7|nr:uncharacterized protein LOC108027551 [Drosophila biarmipes]
MKPKSKQRSPMKAAKKVSRAKISSPRNSVKQKSLKNPMKKPLRRCQQPTTLGSAKVKPLTKSLVTFKKGQKKPMDALQSLGMSRRTKLIDASPQKKADATPVLFLLKDSKGQKVRKASKAGRRKQRLPRMDPRWMSQVEKRTASEGVDFFYNLGMRGNQTAKNQQVRQQRGGGAAGFEGRLAGGEGVGGGRGGSRLGGLAALPGSGRLGPSGLSSIVGGVIAAKDVVVPLTNRLPIIDFISTNEFQNMYASAMRKPQSRRIVH